MSARPKRVREQAVVYLSDRDRTLLDELTRETGLARTELFRRGLWALAAELRRPKHRSAIDLLIAGAATTDGPSDFAERSDQYLYDNHASAAAETNARSVAEAKTEEKPRRTRGSGRGARSH